jgi:hypothetical protein
MSDFGTAALNLREKAVILPLFPKPVPKLIEFWNWLNYLINKNSSNIFSLENFNYNRTPCVEFVFIIIFSPWIL